MRRETYSGDTSRGDLQAVVHEQGVNRRNGEAYVSRAEERQVRNRTLRANVRQRALVRVLERPDLLDLGDLALERLDPGLLLGVRVGEHGDLRELGAERVRLRELLEDAREVRALLLRNLRRRRV